MKKLGTICVAPTDITEFMDGYKTKLNLGKDENGNLLLDSHNILHETGKTQSILECTYFTRVHYTLVFWMLSAVLNIVVYLPHARAMETAVSK